LRGHQDREAEGGDHPRDDDPPSARPPPDPRNQAGAVVG
jgi:hypothetical protein